MALVPHRPPPHGTIVPLRDWWTTNEVAWCLALSPRTLERWQATGTGPPRFHVGPLVRYNPTQLERWLTEDCTWYGTLQPREPQRQHIGAVDTSGRSNNRSLLAGPFVDGRDAPQSASTAACVDLAGWR
jgi:hypothetical protein